MKNTFTIIILTYFLFTLNINRAFTQEAGSQEENILKVGVLVPLKGAQKKIGKVVLSSNQALIWDTLEGIGKNESIEGFGKLFKSN